MPRVLRGSLGGWAFSHGRGTPVHASNVSSVMAHPDTCVEWLLTTTNAAELL